MSTASPPSWVESWCAAPFDLTPAGVASVVTHGRGDEAYRSLVTRFPPGAVVRCTCDEPGCGVFGIVVDIWTRPRVALGLASSPERGSRRSMICPERVEPIGYAGAWTPSTVQLLLDGAEAGG